jgi:hypothetical protein
MKRIIEVIDTLARGSKLPTKYLMDFLLESCPGEYKTEKGEISAEWKKVARNYVVDRFKMDEWNKLTK